MFSMSHLENSPNTKSLHESNMLFILIPSFYNSCKIKYQGNSTCDSSSCYYLWQYKLYCTKDMFQVPPPSSHDCAVSTEVQDLYTAVKKRPQRVKCGRSKKQPQTSGSGGLNAEIQVYKKERFSGDLEEDTEEARQLSEGRVQGALTAKALLFFFSFKSRLGDCRVL